VTTTDPALEELGRPGGQPRPAPRIHPAWWVALVAFFTAIGAAGFRSTPGVLITPLHDEYGWPIGLIGLAVSINLVLFGLTAPFSAALMERFGIKRVVASALLLVSVGSILPIWMTASWQLILCWGLLVGLGTGAMSMSLVAVVTARWFVARRGLVSGVLTAAGATGQLAFLPFLAWLAENHGWRSAAIATATGALLVVPLVLWRFHDHPRDLGLTAYGAPADELVGVRVRLPYNPARMAIDSLRVASRRGVFWLLVGSFAVCGASTNGLVGTHFIPAAHDHGMPQTAAASLLAVVGIFDIVGTIFSGWLTDRYDPRFLLAMYYTLRGASLFLLPSLFGDAVHPSMLAFILFYGLDWVATVPPTMALCRNAFGERGPIVFGWVFSAHQMGAAAAAFGAGVARDQLGTYDLAWYVAGALCVVAASFCVAIRYRHTPADALAPLDAPTP
jgi:predicted MFS family arabinose efflux permease